MAVKRGPPSGTPRFSGRGGKQRLITAIKSQVLIGAAQDIAEAVSRVGRLREYKQGDVVIRQGDYDNDLFLILAGKIAIRIDDRQVATREAGTHVGELALVDSLAKRSATATCLEATSTLRISEPKFTDLASRHPELWRRIAIEIANRLRERNRLLRRPNSRPKLFIGSSTEGLAVARKTLDVVRSRWLDPRLWTDGVFQASRTSIENLMLLAQEADFAILVMTADDVTISKKSKKSSPRDNVVFELGLFMGAIGRERVFILKPKGYDIKIPSDLFGVTWVEYSKGGRLSMQERLSEACKPILRAIQERGPR